MKKLYAAVVGVVVVVLAGGAAAGAAQPPARTFVAVLSADEEVPGCASATNAARGLAVFHVHDGTVEFKIVANNLPGAIIAAHVHVAPKGVAGAIVQPLPPTAGAENGVVARGSFTNAALLAAIQANADNYYVNVHTTVCPTGVIRGQLGDHGPLNN